ncbi:LysR family transcriptional regulator [Saccharopolyspora phatthalungensis]|uniref:DNA-binding transcriptional LysR family regulator n=1 Tax=Saccharopolyspora phatthalungensis TaxID=664693 RepID=A0A840QEZ9_9PSEU|nr:LysR family transcriptional regulator [Saccharopolyspora phatthalungensis]MBB5158617.1 DNA-binding transcriptional LysR family regulator [Saccharopolyspora phatthalungensis]
MLNFIHLQTLQAVLATGSLSAAGKKLGYTTSAVSQQIAALERSLGVKLFERGPRNLWPTAAAQQVSEVAAAILARLDEFETEMRGAARGDRGRLRLGSFPTVGAQLLPKALARLLDQYPHAEFTVHDEGQSAAVVDAVRAMRADLGLVFEYDAVPATWPDDLTVHPVLDEEMVVLAGANRGDPLPETVDLASLSDEIWAANRPDSTGRSNLEHWCALSGFAPEVRFETNDYDVIRGIVRESLGIALVPALALGVDHTITMHRISGNKPRRKVRAIHRSADPNPLLPHALAAIAAATDAFIAFTTSGFSTDTVHAPLATRTYQTR